MNIYVELAKRHVLNTALPFCPPRKFKPSGGDLFDAFFDTLLCLRCTVGAVASPNSQAPVQAGVLQCEGGPNVGFVLDSMTSLECTFLSQGRRPEPYVATVRRYGVDLGITAQTRWPGR